MADGLLDLFSREAGQRRRRDLEEAITYYIPPELRPLLGLATEMNPIVSGERAGQDAQTLFAPDVALMDRIAAGGRMASNMAGIVAPTVVAGRAGMPAAQALEESLLGFSATPQAAALADFALDESGAVNLGGLSYAPARLTEEDITASVPFRRTGTENFAPRREGGGRAKDPALYTPFSTIKQDQIAPYDWEVQGRYFPTREEAAVTVSPEEFARNYDVLFGYPADATLNNVLIEEINGLRLPVPMMQQAGHTFPDNPRMGFASEPLEMGKRNRAYQAARTEDLRPAVTPMVMGPKGGDFSQHVSQTQAQLIRAAEEQIDPSFVPGRIPSRVSGGVTGLLDPRLPYVVENVPGTARAEFVKSLDTGPAMKAGIPSVAATRWATMDPNLVGADLLSSGYRIFEPAPSDVIRRHGGERHATYGGYINRVGPSMTMGAPRPWYLMFPDVAYPSMLGATKPGANMLRMDALPKDLRKFQMNPNLRQQIDPQWVDTNALYDEILKNEGKERADLFAYEALLDRAARTARERR